MSSQTKDDEQEEKSKTPGDLRKVSELSEGIPGYVKPKEERP